MMISEIKRNRKKVKKKLRPILILIHDIICQPSTDYNLQSFQQYSCVKMNMCLLVCESMVYLMGMSDSLV